MKRILIILMDLLIVLGSILLSYKILGHNNMIRDYESNIRAFYIIAPVVGLLYMVFMYSFGLYNATRQKLGNVVYTVFLISVSLMIGIMATCFFVRGGAMAMPRSVIFLSALCYWFFLMVWHMLIWHLAKKQHGIRDVTLIGPEAESLAGVLRSKYRDIYRVRYICQETDEHLVAAIRRSDEVFLSAGVTNRGREKILMVSAERGTGVYFVPEYRDVSIMSASMRKTDDIPTFHIDRMGLTLEERFVKRMLDLLLGSTGFLLALPIGLLVGIVVKLDGGPVFYTQERLTRYGKVFRVLKFRTMVPDAEKLSGPVLAGDKDPRITQAGKFIRAIRMDELPQILNILKGDMSIVGPRPERPFFTEQFEGQVPQYRQRLKVKAGLTGLAQVEGKYNTSFEDKLRYDLLYISNYSLFQDLLIILKTIKILFLKESTEGADFQKQAMALRKEPVRKKSISY